MDVHLLLVRLQGLCLQWALFPIELLLCSLLSHECLGALPDQVGQLYWLLDSLVVTLGGDLHDLLLL